ncbi:MAG: hypothetical protein QME74_00510 [Candidatus Edwardsbacteria bacterium]|nr:hypothetical protein [Candidatus Edwardsbacteria bacterium]
MTKIWLPFLALAGLSWFAASAEPAEFVPAHDSAAITGQAGQRSYQLGRRNLFVASDSLFLRDRLLTRDDQYAINYVTGEVYFSVPLEPADTVIALFKALAVDLPDSVVYAPLIPGGPAAAGTDGSLNPAGRHDARRGGRDSLDMSQPDHSLVRFGGSKTFAIAAGSGRDLSLEQSLNVSANGRLSPGLEINALLSDKNLPLSQAGTTEEASQLDRMFVQARADQWSVTLGDFEIAYPSMSLLQVDRRLEGVQAEGRLKGACAAAAYSAAKGRAETNRFAGVEGKQGPYQLTASDGTRDFRVLANSQKVWLDGELLQAGATADYVMDYERAELTFTPRRPISRDSRVVASFQYSAQSYRRSLYFSSVRVPLGSHIVLRAAFLQEGDDAGHTTGLALSDSQRAALGRAGNDTAKLWIDGGTKMEPGSGQYVRQDSFYVYAGPNAGDYAVSFTGVGTDRGDYVYDGLLGGFRYVGRGRGDYVAKRRLASPQAFRTINMNGEFRWAGGHSFLEGSASRLDRNTLSPLDDGRNAGQAAAGMFSWKRDSLNWGGFEVRSAFANVGRTYWNSNLERAPGFETGWGLDNWPGLAPVNPASPHKAFDLYASYTMFSAASIGGGWGRLGFLDGLWNRKYLFTSALALAGLPHLNYWYKRFLLGNAWQAHPGAGGRRDLHQVRSQWSAGAWGLDAGYAGNLDVMTFGSGAWSGSKFWESSAGWSRKTETLDLGQTYRRRDDSSKDSLLPSWAGQTYANTLTSSIGLRSASRLNLSADHTFRQVRLRPNAPGRGVNSHLAALHADYAIPDDLVRLTLDYSLSSVETALKQEMYVRVPDRTGEYGYDPASGAFYPDTAGNYRRTITDQGARQMTNENSAKAFVSLAPARAAGRLRGIRLDLLASAGISAPQAVDLGWLCFQRDRLWRESNLRSSADLAGDLFYAAPAGWNSRVHLRWRRENDNQYAGRHADKRNVERRGELFLPLSQSARFSASAEYNTAATRTRESGLENGSTAVKAGADWGYQLDPNLELAARADIAQEKVERASGNPLARAVTFRDVSAAPYATRQLGLSGRLRAEAGFVHRAADKSRSEIPLEFSFSRPLGLTKSWSLQYEYRINNYLTSSANYDGRKEPDRRALHNARFELRAYF